MSAIRLHELTRQPIFPGVVAALHRGYHEAAMPQRITVLWLVGENDLPANRDGRFRHVLGDPTLPEATIAGLLAEGAILAVVRTEEEAQRAVACGADEVILLRELLAGGFERVVARTANRAQARLHRDLFLIDIVRKDDTMALEVLAAALGAELAEPLSRVSEESKELSEALGRDDEAGHRARAIAETVSGAAELVEKMRELVDSEPTDELVDLAAVAREVTEALASSVRRVAHLAVRIQDGRCLIGMPRWQTAMMIASLVANAIESIAARGAPGCRLSVCVSAHEGAAVLEVADDGVGMSESERPYAADPFFTTTGRGRYGLGLTLVSARVRRAGGSLMIESDQGAGTVVRVFLPLAGIDPDDEVSN